MRGIDALARPLQLGFVEDVVRGVVDFVIRGVQDVVPTAIRAALVLAVGLAFGYGGRNLVEQNIEDWL
jgi:hypothetical protein